ncbi:MAG: ABC transporter permease subunit [Methylomicrobium sp.]
MSEINNLRIESGSIHKSAASYYHRWRLIKDILARYGVIIGGLGILGAIILIFFYLLYVVYPLFIEASATSVSTYQVPEQTLGKTLFLEIEEQNEIAARFTDSGQAVFFEAATGKTLLTQAIAVPEGAAITSFASGSPADAGVFVYGLSNGGAVVVKDQYKVTYEKETRKITPVLSYPLGEAPLMIGEGGKPLDKVGVKWEDDATVIVAKTGGKIHLANFEKEQSLFAEEPALQRTDAVLDIPAENINEILLDKNGENLYLAGSDGSISFINIADKSAPVLRQRQNVVEAGLAITRLVFLNGDLSLLVGDSSGQVAQWSKAKDELNNVVLKKLRVFKVSDKAVVSIDSEPRRKGFMTFDAAGNMGLFNSTAERRLLEEDLAVKPVETALSPRANAFLMQSEDGQIHYWSVNNEHPEVSFGSIWGKVWYESYQKPDYIWQSSSASNDFEPKYSLTPLVFGTLKAAFYAMLFAMPLSLLGAVYTAYFMAPAMRQLIKPTIELMGALPSVILGFLAGLWLAPFIEKHLAGIFSMLILLPAGVLLFALLWQFIPKAIRHKVPDGWEGALLIPVILITGWFAFLISVPLESALFAGSLREWFSREWGVGYDQRNALVVGVAMGFAVVPTIFSIAEDAVFSVPKHLTVGSLALGATPWQTVTKVVLLTASPGIFSAIMIGLGRAIGETMIVLMATGNTPVMDFSVFQGLRTLAANIAVEMPEAEVDSTHYRILFLAALVLFMFTFIFNTLAEIIRQRLREKYSSL